MQVRPFKPADAAALARLFYAAVHQIAHLHYSPEQLQAWAPREPSVERLTSWASDGRILLVAADEGDQPLAFGDLEAAGHIDHLYCRADVAGRGIASLVYDALEAAANKRSLKLLYTEASEPALRFFLRKGFHVEHRRDFLITACLFTTIAWKSVCDRRRSNRRFPATAA